ncbi:DNA gyrase inhibitor YacG [Candidatus Symbiobacter mobilis]|uniref:DNA gyrase inhibitor YacG n=1 Tax=Candidatus Symbiobacter mobilis CR TaxID=946483 RepID=U5N6J2_9BURK|nr:DNA gyrase inhibitor YacG [Candidatus Symbiobacter mobilis]AGX87156.1 hypothetical protein Cenrod_1062 [Candidatus Symbiobacter mobilis CR]
MNTEKRVPCPACRQPSVYSPSNPFRPFCGAQCRAIDLAAWASEGYRVTAVSTTEGEDYAVGIASRTSPSNLPPPKSLFQ